MAKACSAQTEQLDTVRSVRYFEFRSAVGLQWDLPLVNDVCKWIWFTKYEEMMWKNYEKLTGSWRHDDTITESPIYSADFSCWSEGLPGRWYRWRTGRVSTGSSLCRGVEGGHVWETPANCISSRGPSILVCKVYNDVHMWYIIYHNICTYHYIRNTS